MTGSGSGLLWTRKWIFLDVYKIRISWQAELLSVYQGRLAWISQFYGVWQHQQKCVYWIKQKKKTFLQLQNWTFSSWLLFVCWPPFWLPAIHIAQNQKNITMLISLTHCIVSPQQSPCWGVNHQSRRFLSHGTRKFITLYGTVRYCLCPKLH